MRRSLTDWLFFWKKRGDPVEAATATVLRPDEPPDTNDPLLQALNDILAVADQQPDGQPDGAPLPSAIAGYEVRSELGHGGMGVVYEAWDPVLRRVVALKMLRPPVPWLLPTEADQLAGRFQREAQVLAQLKHEAIVPIYEAKLHEGQPYFVMEYVAGGSLAEHRDELTAAGPKVIVPLAEKVARAVQYAHGHGVLHRDLKPANILLNEPRQPLVSDFGLAKLLDVPVPAEVGDTVPDAGRPPPDDVAARWTLPGCQPGTPAYMAPEQFDASFGPASPATDIWALGVILYELLTGRKPFVCRTREELREQVCRGELVRPRAVRPQLDRRLEAVVLRCLAKAPPLRYPTAGALADALAAWQKPSRRAWLAAAAGALLLTPVATALLWPRSRNPEEDYLRRANALLDELRQRGQVELIPPYPTNESFFALRCGAKGMEEPKRLQDGLNIHCTARCCLVELLPEVPVPNYRIRARMRRARELITQEDQWGVYCRHASLLTEQGSQHSFTALSFVGPEERKDAPGTVELSAALRPCLFAHLLQPVERPRREFFHGAFEKGNVRNAAYAPDANNPWVEITVTVQGGVVTGSFHPGGADAVEMPPVTADDQRRSKLAIRTLFPDLAGVPDQRFDGSALGVYVREADCTVASFVVELIPDN
jgi:serine/threonine protein kinase